MISLDGPDPRSGAVTGGGDGWRGGAAVLPSSRRSRRTDLLLEGRHHPHPALDHLLVCGAPGDPSWRPERRTETGATIGSRLATKQVTETHLQVEHNVHLTQHEPSGETVYRLVVHHVCEAHGANPVSPKGLLRGTNDGTPVAERSANPPRNAVSVGRWMAGGRCCRSGAMGHPPRAVGRRPPPLLPQPR